MPGVRRGAPEAETAKARLRPENGGDPDVAGGEEGELAEAVELLLWCSCVILCHTVSWCNML